MAMLTQTFVVIVSLLLLITLVSTFGGATNLRENFYDEVVAVGLAGAEKNPDAPPRTKRYATAGAEGFEGGEEATAEPTENEMAHAEEPPPAQEQGPAAEVGHGEYQRKKTVVEGFAGSELASY